MSTTDEPSVVSADAARALLVDLVSKPSPSGDEVAVATRLCAFFEDHGREAWIDAVGNVRAPADEAVLLTSHLDTVAGGPPVHVEDGVLWGRGSVDATGALAAMAVAAVRTGVSFAGVVREETDSTGARHLVATRDPPGTLINGEPSGWDGIALGYRGQVTGRYTVATDGAHPAGPTPNAIERAIAWFDELGAALDGSNADGFGAVDVIPRSISGDQGDDGGVTATLEVDVRLPPTVTPDDVYRVRTPPVGTVTWGDETPPVLLDQRNPVATALRGGIRAQGGEPTPLAKTGTCDMNVFAEAWSIPMATYGPGDATLDHAPDEHLELGAFDRAVAVLVSAVATLLSDYP